MLRLYRIPTAARIRSGTVFPANELIDRLPRAARQQGPGQDWL